MIEKFSLPNHGYIAAKLPDDLFKEIQEEVSNSRREDNVMLSGLTNPGVPKHYYLNNCENLLQFIAKVIAEYNQSEFLNIHDSYKVAIQDMNLVFGQPWINYMKSGEYIPNHIHDGILSYSLWVKVPEESTFQFTYNDIIGNVQYNHIPINEEDEGTIVLFPSKLSHQVYPFYNSEEDRISISGNLLYSSQ
jgi:hypothetical protein